ncbi:hypothetical protein ANN_18156 [Periplaneta americana]|uniref:Uncharacterized protein n=1 Tax=Periplaneta americana TaxID=6978 RepID=A0ABQ8SQ23_PERAM|nr:hypothetical protein ANN_18156 [Periplaneta americana]
MKYTDTRKRAPTIFSTHNSILNTYSLTLHYERTLTGNKRRQDQQRPVPKMTQNKSKHVNKRPQLVPPDLLLSLQESHKPKSSYDPRGKSPMESNPVIVEAMEDLTLFSKKLKVRVYKTVILPVVLHGCETWTLTLREEQRLMMFENKHVSRNTYRVLVERPEAKRPLGRPRRRWEDNKFLYSASSYDERVMERRKFSPAPGFEPGFSALRADALSTKPRRIQPRRRLESSQIKLHLLGSL